MINIYGVILQSEGKIYYFKTNKLILNKDEYVVVKTEKGIQIGKVVKKIDIDKINISLDDIKNIERIASDDDYNNYLKNLSDAEKCLVTARKYVEELDLDMNIIEASYSLDRKQLLFNFIADARVDFRELAKKLAATYKTRIELRQIGARDKAKKVCGIGQCGRPLCCSTFLNHMESVTMNMAKNQNIALNPSKINGQCGRLLCCLTYEDDEYVRCQKNLPSVGQIVKVNSGTAKVISVDILNRKYKVECEGVIKEIVVGCDDCKK